MLESNNFVNVGWYPRGSLLMTDNGIVELKECGWFHLRNLVHYGPFETEKQAWESIFPKQEKIHQVHQTYEVRKPSVSQIQHLVNFDDRQ